MLCNSVCSFGIFCVQWLVDYYCLCQLVLLGLLVVWQEEGLVVLVNVEVFGEMWLYYEVLVQLEIVFGGKLIVSYSVVFLFFDLVVWDWKCVEQLFNFSYCLECYILVLKCQYGYFVLFLLYQGKLVGWMDSKIYCKSWELEIFVLWLEEGVKIICGLEQGLCWVINDFVYW